MTVFRRNDDLLRQIPDDVKERTAKAGVTDIDWYAGRLTSSESKGFSEVPPERHDELRDKAKARRKEHRDQKASEIVASMVSLISRFRPRRATTRHAR